jgi:hypothetical protein
MVYSEHLSRKTIDVAGKNQVILDESTNLAEAAKLMKKKANIKCSSRPR